MTAVAHPRAPDRVRQEAVLVTLLARLALWTLPLPTVLRLAGRDPRRPRRGRRAPLTVAPRVLGAAVRAAGRAVPRATCLPQAIAAHVMLTRRGLDSSLHLGVAEPGRGPFRAHAWVESGDEVVVGEASAPLAPLGSILGGPVSGRAATPDRRPS